MDPVQGFFFPLQVEVGVGRRPWSHQALLRCGLLKLEQSVPCLLPFFSVEIVPELRRISLTVSDLKCEVSLCQEQTRS